MIADGALAGRLEQADASRSLEFARASRELYPELQAAWLALGGGHAIFAGTGSPLNKGVGLGIASPIGGEELRELEEFYRSRGTRSALDVPPHVGEGLLDELGRRGYRARYFLNVLAAGIGELPAASGEEIGIHIRRAEAEEGELWSRTVATGFADGGELTTEDLQLFTTQFHGATSRCYLAEMDGEIAGGGFMAISDGVALLGATSVLPEFRGAGVHTALLRKRLEDASHLGCELVTSSTSPGSPSQRNLQRQGLRVMYTKVSMGYMQDR